MSNPRPSRERIASARAKAHQIIADDPTSPIADVLVTLLRGANPPTMQEAIPIMVRHANESGDWASDLDDEQRAMDALSVQSPDELHGGWDGSLWAQWATLRYFMGGAS